MPSVFEQEFATRQTVKIYKESRDTKLGVTFYRCDPQDDGHKNSAIISKLSESGPAFGLLNVGERILSVQGCDVEGPLHAARLLRESEGYLRIVKIPTRADFAANKNRYAQIEAEAARRALEQALPGQTPQMTPRTDAATPRGPNASSTPLLTGLRVLNGAQPAQQGALNLGLNLTEMTESAKKQVEGLQQNIGNLSARATAFFGKVGEMLPTEDNKKKRAALRIQRSYRAFAARGHFHEERGAVLMLQAAARRHKAQTIGKYKRTLKHWAAITIQENWRRHKKRKMRAEQKALRDQQAEAQRLQAEMETAARGNSPSIMTKLSRSLSFTKRNKKSEGSTPRGGGEDGGAVVDKLPTPVLSGASTTASEASPTTAEATPATKKRSLSFTRRKKAQAGGENLDSSKQTL